MHCRVPEQQIEEAMLPTKFLPWSRELKIRSLGTAHSNESADGCVMRPNVSLQVFKLQASWLVQKSVVAPETMEHHKYGFQVNIMQCQEKSLLPLKNKYKETGLLNHPTKLIGLTTFNTPIHVVTEQTAALLQFKT